MGEYVVYSYWTVQILGDWLLRHPTLSHGDRDRIHKYFYSLMHDMELTQGFLYSFITTGQVAFHSWQV